MKTLSFKEKYIDAESVGSNIVGDSIAMKGWDVVSMQDVWTGTPTGIIDMEVSNNNEDWTKVNINGDNPSGSADSSVLELETGARYVRAVYTATSGSGTLSVHYSLKSLGK